MSDLLHEYAWLSYEKKREKVLAVLSLYTTNKKVTRLYEKIEKDDTYHEHRLDEIYSTLLHTAQRKKQKKQMIYETSRTNDIQDKKLKREYEEKKEVEEADILLDSLLDHRCD